MPITLNCPKCHKPFRVRDESIGGKVRCPSCGAVLAVPESLASANSVFDMPHVDINPAEVTGSHRPVAEDVFGSTQTVGTYGAALPAPPSIKMPSMPPAAPPSAPPRSHLPVAPSPSTFQPPRSASMPASPSTMQPPAAPLPPGPMPTSANLNVSWPATPPVPATSNPTAKSGRPSAGAEWLGTLSGLGSIHLGILLLLIPVVGISAHLVLAASNPEGGFKDGPGMLGKENWPRWKEAMALYTGIPVGLAGLFLLFGRLQCLGVPSVSGAKSLAFLALLFNLIALGGIGALIASQFTELNLPPAVMLALPVAAIASALITDIATLFFVGQVGSSLGNGNTLGKVASVFLLAVIVPAAAWITHQQMNLFQPLIDRWNSEGMAFTQGMPKELQNKFFIVIGFVFGGLALILLRYASSITSARYAIRATLSR